MILMIRGVDNDQRCILQNWLTFLQYGLSILLSQEQILTFLSLGSLIPIFLFRKLDQIFAKFSAQNQSQ